MGRKRSSKNSDLLFKMTGDKQRFKLDYRKDGKLDITFIRTSKNWKEIYK